MTNIRARTLIPGSAEGMLLILEQPLSLWGGVTLETGDIMDRSHPQFGQNISGRILAMRSGRGSSSSSSALVELARTGHAPAAILLMTSDPILIMGALVATDLYDVSLPVLQITPENWSHLRHGGTIRCEASDQLTGAAIRPIEGLNGS